MNIQEAAELIGHVENGRELINKTPILEVLKVWLGSPNLKTSEQAKILIFGLLAPRLYPEGYRWVNEHQQLIKKTLQDNAVSRVIELADGAYDTATDPDARDGKKASMIRKIESVNPLLLTEQELAFANENPSDFLPFDALPPAPAPSPAVDERVADGRIAAGEKATGRGTGNTQG